MSSSDHDAHFEGTDSGASDVYPLAAGSVKKNSFMVFQGRPCKVVDYTTSKTGKHGHAKASITGIDIFNGKKYEDSVPTSHNVMVPNIKRTEWTVISYDEDGYVTLMNPQGETRQDLKLSDETDADVANAAKLKELCDAGKDVTVCVLEAMKIEKIIEVNEK